MIGKPNESFKTTRHQLTFLIEGEKVETEEEEALDEIHAKIDPLPWKHRLSIRGQLLWFAIAKKVAFKAPNGTHYTFGKIIKHHDWKRWTHMFFLTDQLAKDFAETNYCCTLTIKGEHVIVMYSNFFNPKLMLVNLLLDKISDRNLVFIIVETPDAHLLTDTPVMKAIVQGLNTSIQPSIVSLLGITNQINS